MMVLQSGQARALKEVDLLKDVTIRFGSELLLFFWSYLSDEANILLECFGMRFVRFFYCVQD
jgi:hypothetical protein